MRKPRLAPRIFGYNKRIKPFTTKQNRVFFDMLLHNLKPTSRVLRTDNRRLGKIMWMEYDPKDKVHIWDRKPLIVVLGINANYLFGLNVHWLTIDERIKLIDYIVSLNRTKKNTIRTPLQFTYTQMVKFVEQNPGYERVYHLYIRKRIGPKAVQIHPKYFIDIARMNLEDFKQG